MKYSANKERQRNTFGSYVILECTAKNRNLVNTFVVNWGLGIRIDWTLRPFSSDLISEQILIKLVGIPRPPPPGRIPRRLGIQIFIALI